jgi:hypothetical protein
VTAPAHTSGRGSIFLIFYKEQICNSVNRLPHTYARPKNCSSPMEPSWDQKIQLGTEAL